MHEALQRKLGEPGSRTTYELEVVRPDGTRVPVEVSSRLILRDGQAVGIQGIARDIRERKAVERALREADRRKDEFLAVLGHELRNPLAPLRNAVEILKRHCPQPEAVAGVQLIERQVATLSRLTEDLLDVSRIAQGKIRLQVEDLDLAEVVRRSVETARPVIEQRRHALSVSLAAERLPLRGDAVRLEQVLTNLLNNAAKFTEPGGRLHMEARKHGEQAVLLLRDNGMGMAPETISSLFEPFRQAEGLPRHGQEGLGIGLALVRGIVELHGGRVLAHSAGPGQGSEFRVWLPLAQRSQE
jgi:signal transduction histidine kinase